MAIQEGQLSVTNKSYLQEYVHKYVNCLEDFSLSRNSLSRLTNHTQHSLYGLTGP